MRMMIYRFTTLFEAVKYILRTEGLLPLFRQTLAFMIYPFFEYRTCYCYEHILRDTIFDGRSEANFRPKIHNFTFEIVSTNQQADELAASGFKFHSTYRDKLNKGAVAFCVFVNNELVHIGWTATTEEAKKSLNELPYRVDFSNKEAVAGGTWTNPKYRGMGLMVYGYFRRFEFLNNKGIVVVKSVVDTSNIASQKAHAKLKPRMYAQARYLKILGFRFWKEKPPQTKPF